MIKDKQTIIQEQQKEGYKLIKTKEDTLIFRKKINFFWLFFWLVIGFIFGGIGYLLYHHLKSKRTEKEIKYK
jgi:H+/Cl- antiporter ClcA